jgi:glycosyltransferase involved in cell wall biosynthesis
MKIATLCLSDGHGGLELYALNCLKHYAEQKIDHVSMVAQNTFLHQQLASNEKIYLFTKSRCQPLPYKNAKKLAYCLEQEKPDILHIHWGKDLALAALAKKISRHKPILIYSRHMAIKHDKHDFYHRWLYKEVNCLLTITKLLKKEALEKLPLKSTNVALIYLGVAAPPAAIIDRVTFFTEHGLNPTIFTLILLGRIELAKGQELAIRAVALLKQQGIIVQLVIAGHAMQPEYLQTLQQNVNYAKLETQISFIDFVTEPLTLLPIFDALALTTENETFGLALVEAMRCGVAVIGSNAGGVPEIIDDNMTGLLFMPNDAADLAAKISDYQQHPEKRKRLALAGQEKANQQFDKELHFAKLVQLYNMQIARQPTKITH